MPIFQSTIELYGTVSSQIPEFYELERNLIVVSRVYNDSSNTVSLCVGYYFSFQGTWTAEMIGESNTLCDFLMSRLKTDIKRPAKNKAKKVRRRYEKCP